MAATTRVMNHDHLVSYILGFLTGRELQSAGCTNKTMGRRCSLSSVWASDIERLVNWRLLQAERYLPPLHDQFSALDFEETSIYTPVLWASEAIAHGFNKWTQKDADRIIKQVKSSTLDARTYYLNIQFIHWVHAFFHDCGDGRKKCRWHEVAPRSNRTVAFVDSVRKQSWFLFHSFTYIDSGPDGFNYVWSGSGKYRYHRVEDKDRCSFASICKGDCGYWHADKDEAWVMEFRVSSYLALPSVDTTITHLRQ